MRRAAIVSPVRTPVGAFGGALRDARRHSRVHPQRLSVRGRPHTCSLSNRKPVDATIAADLVGITFHTPSAHHAYGLAAQFRGRGVPVVLGGPHVTLMPDEAQDHADVIFVGEAEILWEQFLKDFANGRARGSRLPPEVLGRYRRSRPKTSWPSAIDQTETDRARRPTKTGSLPDGFGRVGGIQPDLLQDRCPAFAFAADELNPIGGPGRGLRNDPHELVERVDVFERLAPGARSRLRNSRSRLPPPSGWRCRGRVVCLSCARSPERPGSIPAPSRRCSPRAPCAGPPNRRRRQGR